MLAPTGPLRPTPSVVDFLQPTSLDDALALKAERPASVPIAGGTDVMVDVNFGRLRPDAILDLTRIAELDEVSVEDGHLRLGAGVAYARVLDELAGDLPGMALVARSLGSPQIRNRATIAGNLGTAAPAGDCHPVLLACGAQVEAKSLARGSRMIAIDDFFLGPGLHALDSDELIAAVWLPRSSGRQQFAKIGRRGAMVTAVCSFGLAIDPDRERVGTGMGSAGPTPMRAREAEDFLSGLLSEDRLWESDAPLPESAAERFGELVAAAARPVDDERGAARYRRHALGVLAKRTLAWSRHPEAVA
jgi:CO/xanthine dehydrogenase FAD-binding subunit